MEKEEKREKKEEEERESGGKGNEEGLPLEESPYVKYKDLEDYKRQGYGTEGHKQPKITSRGAGTTEAPTPSGAAVSSQQDLSATDAINRQGVS